IGDIAFFTRLPPMTESGSVSDVPSVGAMEENGLRVRLPTSRQQESDPRLESVLPLLRRRCQTLYSSCHAPDRSADERQIVEGEVKSILKTLGRDLLKYIASNLRPGFTEPYPRSLPKYAKQRNFLSIIQDIKALQAKLNVTRNDDEQRALDEDMTGKARTAPTCYFSTLRIAHSLIDPVVLLVWDPRRSRRTVAKGNPILPSP
ncbi:hypothetical protein EDD16DRAFT_1554950, partial [Pisolithus croceorrhizus]